MNSQSQKLGIYAALIIGSIFIGGNIVGYAFTGLLTLLSFVFLCESISWLKWIVAKTNTFIDIALFAFAFYSKVHFGPTIAMALLFAGIGYTLCYAPYVRATYGK